LDWGLPPLTVAFVALRRVQTRAEAALNFQTTMTTYPQKIAFGEMRASSSLAHLHLR
jgi:hypothetical protein